MYGGLGMGAITYADWQWVDTGFNIGGVRTFRVWMREDGSRFDKVYLTRGSDDTP